MATAPRPVESAQAPAAQSLRQKRRRSPSVAKPAFFVIQVMDENGQPTQFDKKRIRIVSVERSAEQVMELTESGDHPYAFYLRGIVPVQRSATPRSNPASQSDAA